jgi:rhamnogalacturonyl hydrolase YesR
MTSLSRREALALAAGVAHLPGGIPPGVPALLRKLLAREPSSFNTDWFGNMPVYGMLLWARRGAPDARSFATRWLEHHLGAADVATYSGARSRQIIAGGLPLTTYAGHFGAALPCLELARQAKHDGARRVSIDLGRIVLHEVSRNRFGLVNHDDYSEFAIPDTCYFAVAALMAAAELDPTNSQAFRDQAVFQLRAYTRTFLMPDTGLARTVLLPGGLGRTYWTRASGWLLWAMLTVIRGLPEKDREPLLAPLERLAAGMCRVQDSSGGFHVLLDEPATPIESTGTLMLAMGLHEALRQGWIPEQYRAPAARAWRFVKHRLEPSGALQDCFVGWALPAEKRQMTMRAEADGWIAGFVLAAAHEWSLAW